MKHIFKEHNICIHDFYDIFKELEHSLINDLVNYGNDTKSKSSKTLTKSLFLHHIVLHLSDTVLKYKNKEKNIIYISTNVPLSLSIYDVLPQEEFKDILFDAIKKIKKNIPLRIYSDHFTFSDIQKIKDGEKIEFLYKLKQHIKEFDFGKFSFNKTYYFTKKYNLTFLRKEFFNSIKAKQLLIT